MAYLGTRLALKICEIFLNLWVTAVKECCLCGGGAVGYVQETHEMFYVSNLINTSIYNRLGSGN